MHTDDDWKVTTPWGEVIVFKRDIGICNRTPYINLREHAEGLVMLETVEKDMEMFTKRENEKAEEFFLGLNLNRSIFFRPPKMTWGTTR